MTGKIRTYRKTVGVQSGHAASGGGSGVQHVLLCNFELSALRWNIAIPHGHQDGIFIAAFQPLLRLHGRLRPCGVWVKVILEEVRLYKRDGGEETRDITLSYSMVDLIFF